MSNHCIEVICLSCGKQWCDRGCSYETGPSEEALKNYLRNCQNWADKYDNGIIKHAELQDRRCLLCGGKVAMT